MPFRQENKVLRGNSHSGNPSVLVSSSIVKTWKSGKESAQKRKRATGPLSHEEQLGQDIPSEEVK
jgi:hypothetical protein